MFNLILRCTNKMITSLKRLKMLLLFCIIGVVLFYVKFLLNQTNTIYVAEQRLPPLIIWWTNMPAFYKSVRYCNLRACRFSNNRNDYLKAEAILFYGSDFNVAELPLPRMPRQIWGLLHEESPRNVPYIPYNSFLQHFNFSSTFSRYSHYPLTTFYLTNLQDLISPELMVPVGEKTLLRKNQKLAPIAFLQSDCDTMSGRDDFVEQLMKYIDIDSYGQCLNNKQLPESLRNNYLNNLYSEELYHFLARYKFILAYENGICNDYITEKFWRPLIFGSVPIYFGSPTIKDWAPHEKSVIYINDFSNPKLLAEFIKKIDSNDTEYNTYLNHKYNQLNPITNQRLLNEINARDFSINEGNIFNGFECFICEQLGNNSFKIDLQMGTSTSHYNCSLPLRYPPSFTNNLIKNNEDWTSVMAVGRCQSEIFHEFSQKNINFTKAEFEEQLMEKIRLNQCNI